MTTSSDSFRNVTRYIGQDYRFVPTYIRPRDPFSPTTSSTDIKPKEQQGYYPITSLWTNSTNGNIWALAGIANNLAKWILISSGSSGPALMFGVPLGTSPITPDSNGLVNFTSTGSTVAITGSAGGLGLQNINFDVVGSGDVTWQTIIASQTLAAKNGYICVSPGATLSLNLPATATIGDTIEVVLDGSTGWTIVQAAGQQIRFGIDQTTLGIGGSISSTAQGDWITLIAQTNTRWMARAESGNFTVI